MRKEVPLIITFLAGAFFIADYFIPHTGFSDTAAMVNGWAIIVVAFSYILGVGNFGGIAEDTIFDWFFINTYYPMQATMFALLAFFIASAAFRAFRIRTV